MSKENLFGEIKEYSFQSFVKKPANIVEDAVEEYADRKSVV